MTEPIEHIREYWNVDAATYDRAQSHSAHTPAERGAWAAALERLLTAAPARVLDVGAGTGFLSLIAAGLGHRVTALDLSTGMLEHLRRKASEAGLDVEVAVGMADQPPAGPFDVVMERHVTWTLPEPNTALVAWRRSAPEGRLLLFHSLGREADVVEANRARVNKLIDRVRKTPPSHHGKYDAEVRRLLPLAGNTHPGQMCELIEATGWGPARVERLRDVEWAMSLARPAPDRLAGVAPRFVAIGGR